MQFQVPQFVDLKSKIIGPLTLRQFFYLVGGIGVILVLSAFIRLSFLAVLGIPIMGLSVALAFWKINGRPFAIYLLSMLKYAFSPQIYIWKPLPGKKTREEKKRKEPKKPEHPAKEVTQSKLKEVAKKLDIEK